MNKIEKIINAKILREQTNHTLFETYIEEVQHEIKELARTLEPLAEWVMDIAFDGTSSIDVSVSGNKHAFNGVWKALRQDGWEPNQRPDGDKISSFTTFFNKEDTKIRIWFSYSSTVCKRVKVGTEMVERPVYETVCEDTLEH